MSHSDVPHLIRALVVLAAIGTLGLAFHPGAFAWQGEQPADTQQLVVGPAVAGLRHSSKVNGGFVEWRSRPLWHGIRALAGLHAGSGGPYYLGLGAHYDFALPKAWMLGLSFGPGFYEANQRLKLGSNIEFLSSIEFTYPLSRGQRIGLGFGHISNAHLGRTNPGSEFVRIGWQIPLDRKSF